MKKSLEKPTYAPKVPCVSSSGDSTRPPTAKPSSSAMPASEIQATPLRDSTWPHMRVAISSAACT
jgi:hypothetical protein